MTDTKMSHHHILKAITTLCIYLSSIAEVSAQESSLPAIAGPAKVAGRGDVDSSPYYATPDFFNMKSEKALFPIPYTELENNRNLTQNPGYNN